MNGEKATSLPKISWYLIARNGDLSSMVRAGMTLGEDAGGYLSMIPDEAIVELGIEDGRLLVKVISDDHELELADSERARSIRVSPHDAAMVRFPNNNLLIDTSFARTNPYSETLTISVVPAGIADRAASDEAGVTDGEASGGEEIVVPEATAEAPAEATVEEKPKAASVADPGESALPFEPPASDPETSRQRVQAIVRDKGSTIQTALPSRIGAAGGFVAAVIVSLLYFAYLASDKPQQRTAPAEQVTRSEPIQDAIPEPVAPAVPPGDDVVESEASETIAIETDLAQFEPLPAEQDAIADEESAPLQIADAQSPGPLEEEAPLPDVDVERLAAVELLVDVPMLFGSDQTPNETTIDFALRSLQALLIAYPDDEAVVRNLEELTDRLLVAAQLHYDLGEVLQAERLMRQASTTGVSQQAITDMTSYFESTPPGTLIVETGREPPVISPTVMLVPRAPSPVSPAENVFSDLAEGFRPPSRTDATSVSSADVESADSEALPGPPQEEVLQREIYPFAELTAVSVDPPAYPKRALPGTEGVVELEFIITDTGDVGEITVLGDPPGLFVRSALRAVQNWKFVPVERDDKPVSVKTSVRVAFRSGE